MLANMQCGYLLVVFLLAGIVVSSQESIDCWVETSGQPVSEQVSSTALHLEDISDVDIPSCNEISALCSSLPEAPAALLASLYGPSAPKHVYLLVDGTLRAEVAGLFDLDVVSANASSLFTDTVAESLGEAGPWLVDLSISNQNESGDVSLLHDFFARHWPAGYSILISTDASFDALRGHLKRFIKRPILDDGRVLTFRFWDPRILTPFLTTIQGDRSRARRMAITDEGLPIAYILPSSKVQTVDPDNLVAVRISPDADLLSEPMRPLRLCYADFDDLARERAIQRNTRIAERLRQDFATELEGRPIEQIQLAVHHAVERFGAFGFRNHAHLHFFAAWSLFYGPAFEQSDPTRELEAILDSDAHETERFRAFRRRFETFTTKRAV
ncbi:DUF4123 domain-containing protein [Tritonibacter mobilis]|uniref:DUF4123 domain-containing protein n=2 Tax=Tritonibacter mobilis TaxID=379347 RepID=UPI0013A57C61|nr:DUF4123 domain-containing protein [Tritonibacter mobilis]